MLRPAAATLLRRGYEGREAAQDSTQRKRRCSPAKTRSPVSLKLRGIQRGGTQRKRRVFYHEDHEGFEGERRRKRNRAYLRGLEEKKVSLREV